MGMGAGVCVPVFSAVQQRCATGVGGGMGTTGSNILLRAPPSPGYRLGARAAEGHANTMQSPPPPKKSGWCQGHS